MSFWKNGLVKTFGKSGTYEEEVLDDVFWDFTLGHGSGSSGAFRLYGGLTRIVDGGE